MTAPPTRLDLTSSPTTADLPPAPSDTPPPAPEGNGAGSELGDPLPRTGEGLGVRVVVPHPEPPTDSAHQRPALSTQHPPVSRISSLASRISRPRLNPVLRRELRTRMRGGRAFLVLGLFLALLGGLVYALERVIVTAEPLAGVQSFQVGQVVFAGLALAEIVLLVLVVPALTATAISAERERATFDLLRATPVRAWTVVWGKLLAALGYAALLIVAAIPMSAAVFLYGGVAPEDVWASFALLGATTLTFGLLGLCCSALTRRATAATALAYAAVGLLVAGTAGAYVFLDATDGGLVDSPVWQGDVVMVEGVPGGPAADGRGDDPPRFLLAANPVAAMAELVADAVDQSPADPFTGQPALPVFGDWVEIARLDGDQFIAFDAMGRPVAPEPDDDERPLWHITIALYGAVSVVLFAVTVWLVAHPPGRPRWLRRRVRVLD